MNTLTSLQLLHPKFSLGAPLFVMMVFALFAIAGLQVSGRPEAVCRAIACYMMQLVGLVLIGVTAVPVVNALLKGAVLPETSLLILALVFCLGLGTLLHFDGVVGDIDDASVSVMRAIYMHSIEILGALITILSFVWLAVTLVSARMSDWQFPTTFLILGLLLLACFSLHSAKLHRKNHKKRR